MPIFTNPEVKAYLAEKGVDPASSLRSLGLVSPGMGGAADVVRLPGTTEANPTYRLGDALGGMIQDRKMLEPVGKFFGALGSQRGPGTAALLSALLGAAGGAGFGLTTRRDPLMWGLLGAGVGGLGGYGINQLMRARDARRRRQAELLSKTAFYVSNEQDPMQYIQQRLFEDGSTSTGQKVQMVQQLRNLPQQDLMTLADLLRTAVGGAIGYIIARFLMRFGGIGTAVMTGLGGLIGAGTGGPRIPKNMLGLEVDTARDLFGRPRLV